MNAILTLVSMDLVLMDTISIPVHVMQGILALTVTTILMNAALNLVSLVPAMI